MDNRNFSSAQSGILIFTPMKKKFINPYKWKRKVRRGVSSSHEGVSIDERLSLRPQHGEARWRRNPYERERGAWKRTGETVLLGGALLTIFILCYFHSYFTVRTLSFQGLERVSETKITEFTSNKISGKKLLVFKKNNYFSLNIQSLRESLEKEYSFENITVQKKFPHTLIVQVKEKPSALIYDNGQEYTLIGEHGEKLETLRVVTPEEWQAVTRVVTSTNTLGEVETKQEVLKNIHKPDVKSLLVMGKKLPILYDTEQGASTSTIAVEQSTVDGLRKWSDFLETRMKIPVAYTELLEGGEDGYIHTTQGWGIYIKFADADTAFPIFLSLLPKIDQKTVSYIDMRYLSRVYWK